MITAARPADTARAGRMPAGSTSFVLGEPKVSPALSGARSAAWRFMEAPRVRRFGGARLCPVAAGLALALTKQKERERRGLMDNTRLIDLAMKAFALGLCEGHELADQQLGVRVRTGRSLMQKLLPTTSNTLPREYRMQLRLVYGAGFHLGQWRKFNGLNSNGGEEVRGEHPA